VSSKPDVGRRKRGRATSISNNAGVKKTAKPSSRHRHRGNSSAQMTPGAQNGTPVLKDRVSDKYSPAIGSNVGQSQRFAQAAVGVGVASQPRHQQQSAQHSSQQTYQSEASMFQGQNWTPSTPADMGLSQRFNQFNPDGAGVGNVGQSMQSNMTAGVSPGFANMYSFSGGSFATPTPRSAHGQQQQQQHAPGQQSMVSMGSQRMFAQGQSMSTLPYQPSMTAGFSRPYSAYETPQTNTSDQFAGQGMSARFSVTQPQRHSIASQGLPTMQDVEPDYDDADDESEDVGDSEYE